MLAEDRAEKRHITEERRILDREDARAMARLLRAHEEWREARRRVLHQRCAEDGDRHIEAAPKEIGGIGDRRCRHCGCRAPRWSGLGPLAPGEAA